MSLTKPIGGVKCDFLIFSILRQLHLLDIPNHINLFTSDIYDWLSPYKHTRDIRSTLQDAIVQGAVDW